MGTVLIGTGLFADLTGLPPGSHHDLAFADPGLAPLDDIDGDGIPNVADNEYHGTSPVLADYDGDGYRDGLELAAGSDPRDYYSTPVTFSGTRVLVAPNGDDVYIVFLMASGSGFMKSSSQRIVFARYDALVKNGPVALAFVNVSTEFLKNVHETRDVTGQVVAWTLKVRRDTVDLWAVGFGMKEDGCPLFDETVIHRRKEGYIYTLRFPTETGPCVSNLEPTESESSSGGNPGIGFKECEQLSLSNAGSPVRNIVDEYCVDREEYICPSDCGALRGHTVIDLKKIWLY